MGFVPIEEARLPTLHVTRFEPDPVSDPCREARRVGAWAPQIVAAGSSSAIPCPVCSFKLEEMPGRNVAREYALDNGKFVRLTVEATVLEICESCQGRVGQNTNAGHRSGCPRAEKPARTERTGPEVGTYLSSPARHGLHRELHLLPLRQHKVALRHTDGTNVLSPWFVRSFLALELFVKEGVRESTVMRCTLSDYLAKRPSVGEDEEGFCWTVGRTEKLYADRKLAESIDVYIRELRPFLWQCGSGAAESSGHPETPLFPGKGGSPLCNLLYSAEIYSKFAGQLPSGTSRISPARLFALKEKFYQSADPSSRSAF